MADQAVKFRQGDNIEVNMVDQQNINNFSRNLYFLKEQQQNLILKKDLFNQIDDALAEIDLHDDDVIKSKYGDVFISLPVDMVRDRVEAQQETVKAELRVLEGKVQDGQKKLGKLKASLYAKFGNNINLEEE